MINTSNAKPKYIIFFLFLVLLAIGTFYVWKKQAASAPKKIQITAKNIPTQIIEPTKDIGVKYTHPKIEKKREYQIVMLGDSMTYALGPHAGPFYEDINALFKKDNHGILVDNYAEPSTSILTIDKAMNKKEKYWDVSFEPLMSRKFDLILIESFGYNPLSQYTREEGLKKQTEILDQTVKSLIASHPASAIMFVATIAPSKDDYGRPHQTALSPGDRLKEVDERIAFIQNHIDYATAHNIPVINIYKASQTLTGDGNKEYINPDDDIHPSAVGIKFIGSQLADFIYASNIFPK